MSIKEKLGKNILFFDGGMGTMLQDNGLAAGELPETWNLLHPDVIYGIHKRYFEAGCNIVKTNTFGANSLKFDNVTKLVHAGVTLARRAADDTPGEHFVALDIGPSGKLMKPFGDLAFEDAYRLFQEAVVAGEQAGANLILIETMSDTYEIKAAVLAAKENTSLPVFVTMIFDEQGKLLTGADIETATAMLEGLRIDGIGFNCGLGPSQMLELLPKLRAATRLPIIVNPNAGLPVSIDGKTVFNVEPEEFAQTMREIVAGGAVVAGGCCGTTPAHIRAMVEACRKLPVLPPSPQTGTLISSYSRSVNLEHGPVIIGERINPTGKKRFKQALRDHDIDYILKEGLTQQENGAHILDVNVGLPEIDEPAMMEQAVIGLQSILDLPLQIDTSDTEAMERALRLYVGKPLINSVNGKQESMRAVFPLVKKYGGAVVALALDENGIPDTADGRIKVAKKIIETAKTYGIDKKDILVDALAMTISTGQEGAKITLDTLRRCREELGVHTILGVSNISFGLPQRENINTAFFTLALEHGLSAGIINPASAAMMKAYDSFCALYGYDPQCGAYIEKYAGQALAAPAQTSSEITLSAAIIKGLRDDAFRQAQKMVETREPLDIINHDLIPALDVVGQGFEKGTMFLPQLLMSAEAAKAGFEALQQHMVKNGNVQEKKGKIILATVKGDIHDIGKNIVKVLLENYGYDVIDLGKDVEPQLVVETAVKNKVRLVGLSALMTTTVTNMELTIKLLHEALPGCKVMVGGAVLTQDYADMIGADSYSKDAMGSVHYANELFGA